MSTLEKRTTHEVVVGAVTLASGGHVGVVEKILDVVGINVNVVDKRYGATSLLAASDNGHLAVVNVLIKAFVLHVPWYSIYRSGIYQKARRHPKRK